ncbi:serine hydrolase [Microbacterium koreense]
MRSILEEHVAAGTMPGAVAFVASADDADPEIVSVGAAAADGPPIAADAVFRIQSMTKPVTTVAALRLVAAGDIGLDDPVDEWIPELSDRRVLRSPDADLDDTIDSPRPITLRHLLTNTSGYGMMTAPTPLQQAMLAGGTEAGPQPSGISADEWLARVAELPLAFAPGDGWRYHHSFGLLGILISRVTGRTAQEHLAADLFEPLGMVDTGYWTPLDQAHRLPAAYRHTATGLIEMEPAGGGFYAGEPDHDVSHEELVSTAGDWWRFSRMLALGGRLDGDEFVRPDLFALMTSDQTPDAVKTPDSFFPGFWNDMGWGFGVGVHTSAERAGRYGWSGGQGTDFWIAPDGTVRAVFTQVEMGEQVMGLFGAMADVEVS